MNYLLDTCIISELIARQPDPRVVNWIDSVNDANVYLSVITIGEIRKGIEKLPESRRRAAIAAWLDDELLVRFSGRILSIDVATMLLWGQLVGALESRGRRMAAIDSLIAAQALQRNLSLVTRNADDFRDSGAAIVNPWM